MGRIGGTCHRWRHLCHGVQKAINSESPFYAWKETGMAKLAERLEGIHEDLVAISLLTKCTHIKLDGIDRGIKSIDATLKELNSTLKEMNAKLK